ncbi:MAG: hypothetical protein Fur0015_14720 [Ignavibacteriales bacterium]
MKRATILFLIFILIGCTKEKKTSNEQSELQNDFVQKDSSVSENTYAEKEPDRNAIVGEREFRYGNNGLIKIIEQYGDGYSAHDITIKTIGFLKNKTYKYESAGYVDTVMIADLNSDGEKEYYITIGNGGSGGMEELWVFAVINQELKNVDTREIDNVLSGKYFDASKIQGHDNYHIEGNYLVNTVPLYNEDDPNCCPTGGEISIYFGFKPAEDGGRLFFVRKD